MDEVINFDDIKFSIKKRKTESISFEIDHDDHQFILVSPFGVAEKELEDYIRSNLKNFKEIAEMFFDSSHLKECVDGENIVLFNTPYSLKLDQVDKIECDEHNRILKFPISLQESFKEELVEWLEFKLIEFVNIKLDKYSKKFGHSPKKILVSDLGRKWGVCTPKGTIKLNWKLAISPYFVVEYVLCHELAHLKHLDHSRQFYSLLDSVYIRRREAERWLENNFLTLKV